MKRFKYFAISLIAFVALSTIAYSQDVSQLSQKVGGQEGDRATPSQILQKRKSAASVWDGAVKPGNASSVDELFKSLPSVPSVEELAQPTEAMREKFYTALVGIDLRVEELERESSCSDEEMVAFRDKMYDEMAVAMGLTPQEMRKLDDENISEAEYERITEKMTTHLLGGISADDLEKKAKNMEKSMEGVDLDNMTDEQMLKFMQENPDFVKQLSEFGAIAGGMNESREKMDNFTNRNADLEKRVKLLDEKYDKMMKDKGIYTSCESIAREYEDDLKYIYEEIFNTDDASKISRLYDEAMDMMSKYRFRAAALWRRSLEMKLNNIISLRDEVETLQQDMVDAEMIPPCALQRASFNMITDCSNILNEAYSDFPQPDVMPAKGEILLKIDGGETMLIAESGFATSVEGFLNGSMIYTIDENGVMYVYEKGKKRRCAEGEEIDESLAKRGAKPSYGSYTSSNGKHTATFSRDGSLTLYDGTVVYPLAFQKKDNMLLWIDYDYRENVLYKYTAKL